MTTFLGKSRKILLLFTQVWEHDVNTQEFHFSRTYSPDGLCARYLTDKRGFLPDE